MSRLEELIQELCLDGVEYKKLRDIGTSFFRGSGIKRTDITSEGIPCVRYGEIYTEYGIWFDKCKPRTLLEKVSSPKYFSYGAILFAITGESIIDIAKCTAYLGNEKCLAGGDIVVMLHNENPKYLSYALSTSNAVRQKGEGKVKSKVVHSSVPAIQEIEIPVPPLDIQRQIVHILDQFTTLRAELSMELSMELSARRKQYEYYRDKLLMFGDDVPRVELSSVIHSLNTGLNPRLFFRLNTEDAENYYITIREIQNGCIIPTEKTDKINDEALRLCNNRSNLEIGDVLFSGTGTIGETAVIKEDPTNWNIKEGVYTIKPNQKYLRSEYLRYILMTQYMKDLYMKKVAGGTVKSIPMKEMKLLMIPLPSLEEQDRLVLLMTRFDALCNDISDELSAEIEARTKQYEYYRDKLLTFKRKDA